MHKIIILNNKKCQFVSQDAELVNKIGHFLSYRAAGYEYTAAFKYHGWNGMTHLMTKKGAFPAGLLKTVQNKCIELEVDFETEDRRMPVEIMPELDITHRLSDISKIPREHQVRILETALQHKKGIIRAATGSGKSLCTALITAKINKPTIIYVIGIDLLQQFHDLFSSIFDEEIGFIGNGVCNIKRINIASVWTIGRSLNVDVKDIIADDEFSEEEIYDQSNEAKILEMLETTKLHIFDESHTITANTLKEIFNHIDPERIYGFSGTPYRDDNSDLLITGMLGDQIINVSAAELIEKGLLVQPIIKFVSIPKISMWKDTYHTVYKNYVVENKIRNNILLEEVRKLVDKKYKVLVLFKQVKHGKILAELFEDEDFRFEMLYGNDKLERRNEVKQMITDGDIDIILASSIFDLGVDLPIINGLVLTGGGKSSIRTLQRIGRVIRSHPDKKFVAVVDTFDQTRYLKGHAQRRYEIYMSELGFCVHKSKDM